MPSDAVDLNDHGYAEVYTEFLSEGDTFKESEGVKEECWETGIPPKIYRSTCESCGCRRLAQVSEGQLNSPAARRQEVYAADSVIVINLVVVEFKTLKIYVYTVHYR